MINKNYYRGLLSVVPFTLTCAFLSGCSERTENTADVIIVSSGGISQNAQRAALWDPASKVLGMKIGEDTSQSWGEARAQVDSGAITWDIVQFAMFEGQLAANADVIIKLPNDIVDSNNFLPGTVTDYCIGTTVYSTVLAYSTEAFGGKGPESMKDFWDVEKFPGKRGMYRNPRSNVEAAVLAMGYPASEIYEFLRTPQGRKAAIDKIAELKPYAVWWQSGAQSMQLVQDGEVPLIYAWNGRIQDAIRRGAPYKINFNQGRIENDCYGILKGAPHTEKAVKFLREALKPEYTKNLPKYVDYGSADMTTYADYDEATLSRLSASPQNLAKQYSADIDFWIQYGTELSEAFDTMLLTN
jgi:putative spermidine/putrescine transport system substrate-binding protein